MLEHIEIEKSLRVKLLRDPLVHFAVAGALIFAGIQVFASPRATETGIEPIRIGDGEIRWLEQTFANQWQRAPAQKELDGLIAGLLEEQLLAREAKSLGLDRDDTIIRRRLAQKLNFIVEDTARIVDPSDDELRTLYQASIDEYRTDERISLMQIYFDPTKREHPEQDAKLVLESMSENAGLALGDPLLLEPSHYDVDRQRLSNMFGADFSAAVLAMSPGTWNGPVKSGFGIHLVKVMGITPPRVQPFNEVRLKVLDEWRQQKKLEIRAAYLAKLREKYGVVVEGRAQSPGPQYADGATP